MDNGLCTRRNAQDPTIQQDGKSSRTLARDGLRGSVRRDRSREVAVQETGDRTRRRLRVWSREHPVPVAMPTYEE
jgi:hypothetical protein